MGLTRTVVAKSKDTEHKIEVSNEEIASATDRGCAHNTVHCFDLRVKTPQEYVEKHPFNTNDGKT